MVQELPFYDDPLTPFRRLQSLGDAVLLDSGGATGAERWDIIAAQPDLSRSLIISGTDDDDVVESKLEQWRGETLQLCSREPVPAEDGGALPFTGGYIGYLAYSLGARLMDVPEQEAALPQAVARFYPWAVLQDRHRRKSWLVGDYSVREQARISDLLHAPAHRAATRFQLKSAFRGPWDLERYTQVFGSVKDYIRAGDCYQINLGQCFKAPYEGDLLQAYERLRSIARAPFSAFLPVDEEHALLCMSPERFLTVAGGQIETRPIKGTRPRYEDSERDARSAAELLASAKERAENLMIVDLMRNDISRFCEPGSIRADELFKLESYATVHHLVSTVRGTLKKDALPVDLLLACLPGGSITGAPKRRAMEIIRELEVSPRQAWCGSIFYLSRCGRLDSNITIRTLFNVGNELHCWAGGGLVDDSTAKAEFQEQRDKVGAFIGALETLRS